MEVRVNQLHICTRAFQFHFSLDTVIVMSLPGNLIGSLNNSFPPHGSYLMGYIVHNVLGALYRLMAPIQYQEE